MFVDGLPLSAKMWRFSISKYCILAITHNSDSGRFNIKDSITKQFVAEILLIIYESNKDTVPYIN